MANSGDMHDAVPLDGDVRGWRMLYLAPALVAREVEVQRRMLTLLRGGCSWRGGFWLMVKHLPKQLREPVSRTRVT